MANIFTTIWVDFDAYNFDGGAMVYTRNYVTRSKCYMQNIYI